MRSAILLKQFSQVCVGPSNFDNFRYFEVNRLRQEMICMYTAPQSVLTAVCLTTAAQCAPRHQSKKPTLGNVSLSVFSRDILGGRAADLHDGAGWDRLESGFGDGRASMSHPLPLSRVPTTHLAH